MAAEGEFPKSDGDILFASEVNAFNTATKAIWSGGAEKGVDSATNYFNPNQFRGGEGGATDGDPTTETTHEIPIPISGTLQNLYTRVNGNVSDNTTTITVMHNGSASTLTVTHASSTNGAQNDTANTVAVSAGDRISIRVINTGTGDFRAFNWSVQII